MKKLSIMLFIVIALGLVGCSETTNYDANNSLSATNDNYSDNDAETSVDKVEEPEPIQTNYDNLYLPEWARWDMDINELKDMKLKTYFVQYDGGYNFLQEYNEIKNAIIEKYGNPSIDEIIWTDETYKNDPDKFDQAFKYGYVTMNCKWAVGENVVILKWDYKNTMYLAYCHKSYEKNL